jgi:hypothetical protein
MEFCAPSLHEHLIDMYNPDIFICSTEQGEVMRELYNPTKMRIYTDEFIYDSMTTKRARSYGLIVPIPGWPQMQIVPSMELNYMWQGMKCKEMIAEHEKKHGVYDVVVSTRFDIKFLHIQKITKPVENRFYLPLIDAHQWKAEKGIHWHLGYSAHMWWGTSKVAQILLDGFHYSDDHYKETGIWQGEMRVKWMCDKMGIKPVFTDVTHMIIKGDKDHPRSNTLAWSQELSATHYPQYCDPPLPIEGHVPVPQYTWGGEPTPPGHKQRLSRMEKRRNHRFQRLLERRKK